MIGNEHEFRTSRGYCQRLLETRAAYAAHPDADRTQREWLVGGVDLLLGDVDATIAKYEALLAGDVRAVNVAGLGDLPGTLVQARIAAGLTQRQPAERLRSPSRQCSATRRACTPAPRSAGGSVWPGR